MKYLKTTDIARTTGVHPNTVRLYEEWGLLPPIERGANGYRLYTVMHLEQVKLIRLSTNCTLLGGHIRECTLELLKASAGGKQEEALELAEQVAGMIKIEQRQVEAAEKVLESWASGNQTPDQQMDKSFPPVTGNPPEQQLNIREAATLLDATPDMLRDWERNRLICVPRNAQNGYRQYGVEEIRKLRIIRLLRRSRYSNMSILRVMQQLESGETGNLREIINTPEYDEERGYLCFTDQLLSTLENAVQSIDKMVLQLNTMIRMSRDPV